MPLNGPVLENEKYAAALTRNSDLFAFFASIFSLGCTSHRFQANGVINET